MDPAACAAGVRGAGPCARPVRDRDRIVVLDTRVHLTLRFFLYKFGSTVTGGALAEPEVLRSIPISLVYALWPYGGVVGLELAVSEGYARLARNNKIECDNQYRILRRS